jgi:TetR/AcrR family transcriptional regulator, mexJK operon transcriptional repressor
MSEHTRSTIKSVPMTRYRAGRRDAKRATILNAARRVFLEHGYGSASTEMIRAASGVSKATVYAHFRTKKLLFEAVCRMKSDDFIISLQNAVKGDYEPKEYLSRFGVAFLRYVLSKGGLSFYRLMVAGARRFPELGVTFYRTGITKTASDLVATYLKGAHARGWIQVKDPSIAANHFLGMLRGELFNQALLNVRKVPSGTEQRKYVVATVDLFLLIYSPKAQRKKPPIRKIPNTRNRRRRSGAAH